MGVPERREMKRHRRHNLKDRFEIIKTLGQGTYGKVKLAVEKSTGIQYAIKSIRKKKIETEQDLIRVRREIEIMATLYHPHIVTVHEVFENRDRIVLVMDYASGGELYDYINERKGLYEEEARKFFRQMVSAVHYLHANGIVHRDLKLENILLDAYGNVKIADFGLSNVYGSSKLLNTFCGSPLYASPEIVNGQPYYGPEVDCWSLGVVLYTLVYGAMPFDGSDFKRLKQQITEGDYYEPKVPSDATGLIKQLLCPAPSSRATVDDICVHWWVNFGYEQNPSQITEAYAEPVDRNSLVESLRSGNTTDSDTENSHHVKSRKEEPCLPLKGILKKPQKVAENGETQGKHYSSAQTQIQPEFSGFPNTNSDNRLKKPRSNCELNSDWLSDTYSIDSVEYNNKKQSTIENRRSVPISCDIAKAVFDSTKKPKKSILKNRNGNSRSDSGCIIDEQMNIYTALKNFEVVYPFEETSSSGGSSSKKRHDSQRDSAYIERKQSCDSELGNNENSMFDLNDIESVLDDIVNFEVATEKRLANNMKNNSGLETTNSGLYSKDKSSGSTYDFPNTSSTVPVDYTNYDPLKEPVKYRKKTSTPNRPLKSILKRNSRNKENSWRYSLGSQGSNSSADILDFSYDSTDGEYFMQEFCAVPIPLNDEEEQALQNNIEVTDANLRTNEAQFVDPLHEPWPELDIMQWQDTDVPKDINTSTGKAPVNDQPVEEYDNLCPGFGDNEYNTENMVVNGNNTHGEECAIIDLKINELNEDFSEPLTNHRNSGLKLVTGDFNDPQLFVKTLESPPPLPERPPPIGAPASPVRYRVTPPPTPPPPLPETPPPPFKAFELDIFELDLFVTEHEQQNKEDAVKESSNEALAIDLVSEDIQTPNYDKVFDAIELQAKAASKSNNKGKVGKILKKDGRPSGNDGLDKKLLAQMQGYFQTDDSLVDFYNGRSRSKSHSAQAITETDNGIQKHPESRPLSKELQDTLDFYNLELYEPFEKTKLHISEDDLISIQDDKAESNRVNSSKLISSCSETDEELVSNIKGKILLHIDSPDNDDTRNESLAPSSHEDLVQIDAELMELFIEEDTMQKNVSQPANSDVTDALHVCSTSEGNSQSIPSSWENIANESDAGSVEYGVKQKCVQSLPCLVITDEPSFRDKLTPTSNCQDSYCVNTSNCVNSSCDLYIDEDNLITAISKVGDSTTNPTAATETSLLPVIQGTSKPACNNSSGGGDSSNNKHYLDDIMEKIDLLGEELDTELMNSGPNGSVDTHEDIFIDFEEASKVCRQALEISEKLEKCTMVE